MELERKDQVTIDIFSSHRPGADTLAKSSLKISSSKRPCVRINYGTTNGKLSWEYHEASIGKTCKLRKSFKHGFVGRRAGGTKILILFISYTGFKLKHVLEIFLQQFCPGLQLLYNEVYSTYLEFSSSLTKAISVKGRLECTVSDNLYFMATNWNRSKGKP